MGRRGEERRGVMRGEERRVMDGRGISVERGRLNIISFRGKGYP
jgi:hypothetical protein